MAAIKKIVSKVGRRNIESVKAEQPTDKSEIIKKNKVVENEQNAEFGDNILQGVTEDE